MIGDCMDQSDGYESMKQILESTKPPFSVLCYSDYIAIGAICAIQERGYSLPHDIALMGNDNLEILSFVKPRLSTIGAPKLRMGIRSAEFLLEMISDKFAKSELDNDDLEALEENGGNDLNRHIVMKPELIIRETS